MTDDYINIASVLKKRQGPLLFQLLPNFKKDVPRLDAFLDRGSEASKHSIENRLQHRIRNRPIELCYGLLPRVTGRNCN